jgi:predicted transcriptional regulator
MATIHKVEEFMDKKFVTLHADYDVYKAIDIFLEKGVTSSVVVDDNDKVVGILSEKDCLKLMTKGSYYQLPSAKVGDFMTKDVFCAPPYTDVFKVADIFINNNFRRLIITDEDSRVIGQITRHDMLRTIKQLKKEEKEKKIAPIL